MNEIGEKQTFDLGDFPVRIQNNFSTNDFFIVRTESGSRFEFQINDKTKNEITITMTNYIKPPSESE